MPRFAANLGFAPLEPMKSELGPILPTQPGNISPTEQPSCEVPAAKFDWNGSGLTNPLDCKFVCYYNFRAIKKKLI